MFGIFRRSSSPLHGNAVPGAKPVLEWCPTRTARAAQALFQQLCDTGYFLGALNTRHGFAMRTLPDGLEAGINADMKISADVAETEVIMRIAGIDPARVALMSIGPAIAECLDNTTNWDIQTAGATQRLTTDVNLPTLSAVLHIVCEAERVDPMGSGQHLDGTVVSLQLQRTH